MSVVDDDDHKPRFFIDNARQLTQLQYTPIAHHVPHAQPQPTQTAGTLPQTITWDGSAPSTNLGSAATMIDCICAHAHVMGWFIRRKVGVLEDGRRGERDQEGSQEEEDEEGPPMKEELKKKKKKKQHKTRATYSRRYTVTAMNGEN